MIYSRCSWNQLDIMLESLVKYWNSESLLYYKHYWSFVTFSSFADWLCPNFPCFISSFEIWISQRGCWKFGKSFDELCSSTFRSVGLSSFQINVRFSFFALNLALLMYFYFILKQWQKIFSDTDFWITLTTISSFVL